MDYIHCKKCFYLRILRDRKVTGDNYLEVTYGLSNQDTSDDHVTFKVSNLFASLLIYTIFHTALQQLTVF